MSSENNCIFLSRRSKPWWRSHHLAHLYHTDQKYKLLRCLLWKQKEITYDELSLFMKPFAQHGESDLAGIERRSANLPNAGKQNMNYAMPYFAPRILWWNFTRCMQTTKALVVILTILTFLISYLWLVIWFTALNTTNYAVMTDL